ncbi:ABC transporter permease subunit [Marispirochaeta aestuarii]|uniref:sugar ABC transporter permease n=1 Tax=Marispirochaeta aestuarii TaxID=1963862 RepID=UPI0029C9000B|nr:sugar ABC transporter permease [Marispirochaeta aestuarii]
MILNELKTELKRNIRDYGMYIALFIIFLIFGVATDGIFLSSRNISNLLNQTGYLAVLAIGVTLVIVIRHIDLSVGFLSGFLGAIAAIGMVFWHLPIWIVIPMILVLGIVAGLITAYPVAQLGIPAFVASLAGWLIYRGALLLATLKTGTIIIPNATFNAMGNGFIPDIFASDVFLPEVHKLTLIIGLLLIGFNVVTKIRARKAKIFYGFETVSRHLFIGQMVFMSVIIAIVTWILAGYNGMSWTLVIVLLVVAIYSFVTKKTVLGRHIYAVGGNPEAAELSGINVKKITFIVFGSMGMLSGLSGMLFAARLQSATTTAGTLFELDAIAAAYIGGVSAAGGVGSVVSSLIGAIVYTSLTSGMNLMGIDIAAQYIVRGAVLALAVIFDVTTRKIGTK